MQPEISGISFLMQLCRWVSALAFGFALMEARAASAHGGAYTVLHDFTGGPTEGDRTPA